MENQWKNYTDLEDELDFLPDSQTTDEMEAVQFVLDRQKLMDEKRSRKQTRWEQDELQLQSLVEESFDGKAVVNMPIEQNQIEMYQWQINPTLNYSVDPEGRTNVNQLILSKVVLDHFVKKEWVLKQIRRRDYNSGKYWSWILGVTIDKEVKDKWKSSDDEFYSDTWIKKRITLWHLWIKDIPLKKVWFDERPNEYEDCIDCIYEEDESIEEFRMKFTDEDGNDLKPFKHIMAVGTDWSDLNPYWKDTQNSNSKRNIKIRHYYNKVTGTYRMVADKKWLIYEGKITSEHGELPFVLRQFYPDTSSIYGISLIQKMESVKPYINNFLKVALDGMWYSVAPILLTGNGSNIDGEMYYDPSTVNIRQFTGDVQQNNVREMQFQANIDWIMEIIKVMEDFAIQNTGINVKAPYSAPVGTAFEAWLQKEEQNTRMQAIYQIRDEAIEKAMTLYLCNIMQYAPLALWNFLMDDTGNKEFKPYQIKVQDKKVIKREDGNLDLQDDIGNADFFDLTPELLEQAGGLKVRIDTPTNQTVLKSLEKAEFKDMVGNALTLTQVFPWLNIWSWEERLKKLETVYGFDIDKLYLKSSNDKRQEKISQVMDMAKSMQNMQVPGMAEPAMWGNAPLPVEPQNLPAGWPATQDMMATPAPDPKSWSLSQLDTITNDNPAQAMNPAIMK